MFILDFIGVLHYLFLYELIVVKNVEIDTKQIQFEAKNLIFKTKIQYSLIVHLCLETISSHLKFLTQSWINSHIFQMLM